MSTVDYPHIEFDSESVPIISGTTTKVIEVVQDHLAHHWDAEDIHRQYPYLSLAQIYAALTYYYDHEQELDQEINRRLGRVQDIRSHRADAALQAKLRKATLQDDGKSP
jgi:uncharacterized protein (DUF433 family)